MTTNVAEVAAKLTEAQREAFLSSTSPNHIAMSTRARCRAAMQDKGLVERPMYSERLTPLGEAVRQYLQEQET